jgi:ribosome recycling factor
MNAIFVFRPDRPTVEARKTLYATAHRQAEETRVQIRNIQQAGVKHGNFKKHSTEIDEVRCTLWLQQKRC